MNDEIAALTYIKELAQFSLKSREEIDAFVEQKLDQVIHDSSRNCDFYKNRDISTTILTKEQVRDNIHTGMISNAHLGHPCLVVEKTSGSTADAVPFAYLMGFERYARMVFAFMINTNWRWGNEYCVLSTLHCSRDRCSTEDLPDFVNRVKIPTSENIFQDVETQKNAAAILRDHQDSVVHCDPLYLCAVALYCERHDLKLSFKGISSTYELLTPAVQRYLERIFNCKVFDNYGCSEFGPIAFGCPQGHKHIYESTVLVEIINKGRYLDPEVGEIIVTSLDNPAMPLIRYCTGDVGKLLHDICSCGRTARMLEICGRKNQSVNIDGILYTERDIAQLMNIPGVVVYQFAKNNQDILVDVILEPGYRAAHVEVDIRNIIKEIKAVRFFDHIKPEPSGKFKSVDHII